MATTSKVMTEESTDESTGPTDVNHFQLTSENVADEALISALKHAHLDVNYWVNILKIQGEVTEYEQLFKFSDKTEFQKLENCVRDRWEVEALKEMVGVHDRYQINIQQRDHAQKQEQQCNQVISALVSLQNEGKNRSNIEVKEHEEQLKQILQIPDDIWMKTFTGLSLGGLIDNFSDQLREIAGLEIYRSELSPKELLERASDGLALKGILVTNNVGECTDVRETVIEVPNGVRLKSSSFAQKDGDLEHGSQAQTDQFFKSLQALGYGIATSGGGLLDCDTAAGFLQSSREDQVDFEPSEEETYVAKVKYSYIPTASYELLKKEMKLCKGVVKDLKELERQMAGAGDKTTIQKQSADFLKKYGSHVNTSVVLGGVYTWHASYHDVVTCDKEKVHSVINDGLSGLTMMSYSGLGITNGGSMSGDQVKPDLGTLHDDDELSKLTLTVKTVGGLQEVTSLPLWKIGLLKSNAIWAVIDRGPSFDRDFVGIWDLIQNNSTEFSDAKNLAETLQQTWQMTGLSPDLQARDCKGEEVPVCLNDFLASHVQEWSTDEEMSVNAVRYLQQLIDYTQQCCSDSAGIELWVRKLNTDTSLYSFLKHVLRLKEEYSQSDLEQIYSYLNLILKRAQGHDFPLRSEISQFVASEDEEYIPDIMMKHIIQDIASLVNAIKQTLLPAMEAAHAKANCPNDLVMNNVTMTCPVDKVEIQATRDIEITVEHIQMLLEKSDKHYELILLQVVLHEMTYDSVRKGFKILITEQSLIDFVQKLESLWEEFLVYHQAGVMQVQAFLIQFLILSLPENSKYREQDFQDFICRIQDLWTSDITITIAKYVSSTPYHWEGLLATLDELKKGNKSILQYKAVDITDFDVISKLETQKDQVGINQDETSPIPDDSTHIGKLLVQLGLTNHYPSKISLQDVMAVGSKTHDEDYNLLRLPWHFLQKLIMLDYNARESEIRKAISRDEEKSNMSPECCEDDGLSTFDGLLQDLSFEDDVSLNPLDVFLVIYFCCDMVLKQTLAHKMFTCRLAVPFICPQPPEDSLLYSLWALRSIIVEWMNKDQVCMESSVVCQPVKIVSFLRLGKPSCSKSVLLNNVLSDQAHHTFWNRDCPLGNTDRSITDGLVEAQWYIPSGKATDAFEDVTMFLNLRGDVRDHKKQVEFLQQISNVIVCCFETTNLGDPKILEVMKNIHDDSSKVILLLAAKDPALIDKQTLKKSSTQYLQYMGKSNMANTKSISGIKGNKIRTPEDLKQELRTTLHQFLAGQEGKSIEESCTLAMMAGIEIDEHEEVCREGKKLAKEVISCMEDKSTNECKTQMLPLQGEFWQEWSKLLKHKQHSGWTGMSDTIHEKSQIQMNMTQLRQNQLEVCKNLSKMMKTFLQNLLNVIDSPIAVLYLHWLKIYLDEKSRNTLPGLHRQYHKKWLEVYATKDNAGKAVELKRELEAAEKMVAEASLGVEHLLREITQIYEAALESKLELGQPTRETIDQLPTVAAKLLMKGQPIEIMDGDAANVPLTWVKAVFSSLTKLFGDKKLFVISVLGIQSSGKSTLLNTMFGLRFAVSAGRCTRGVYMQLTKVDKEICDLPYDYILVLDTEGLRAPELGHLKHNNDNQLATFVIGLGDVTILNIKGENVAEVSDVLQIAVHAFLRMKIVNKNFQLHRTCVFIHQNVAAVNAKEKMQRGCQKLKERLDEMTREASAIENIIEVSTFNEVIDFDGETNVFYFSDLWHGDPPMAPANPGYAEKVQEVKDCLLNDLPKKQETFLSFLDMKLRVEDLWKGVLSENFVFSFRNSLAAKAYNSLEKMYHEKSWDIENSINEWITQEATVQLERCSTAEELEKHFLELLNELHIIGGAFQESASAELEQFFENHNLKDILIEWKTSKTESLNSDTKVFIERAEREIRQKKDSLRVDLVQRERGTKLNTVMMTKAKDLADVMKGQEADEHEVQETFKRFWTDRENEYAASTSATTVPIENVVECLLYKRLQKDSSALQKELHKNPLTKQLAIDRLEGSISIRDIKDSHISVQASVIKQVVNTLVTFFTNAPSAYKCRPAAANVINNILRNVDIYLRDIIMLNSNFMEVYATNVIKKVVDGVLEHNQSTDQNLFRLLPNLMVKIAVHACRYAIALFKKMQRDYNETHAVQKKVEAYKNAAWGYFKNTVSQCTKEKIAADFLANHLEVLVKQAVKNRMSGEIVNHVVRYFNRTKFHLIVRILADLTEGPFADYMSYIRHSKDFSLQWVTSFTKKEIFNATETRDSMYVIYAEQNFDRLAHRISNNIKTTTEVVCKQKAQGLGIGKWVKIFHSKLRELPIKEEDLKPMIEQNVENFENLEQLLMERLDAMREMVINTFKAETPCKIKWEGRTPYKQILDRLWGCEAQCPFCKEVCQRTDPHHLCPNNSHQCIQHRPTGVGGVRCMISQVLCVESCNFQVQSYKDFGFGHLPEWEHLEQKYHPYREYKKFLPDWDIAPSPNMESSKYWMWVMAKYKHELAKTHIAKVPDIPEAWDQITKQEALDSLREYYN